MSLQQGWLGRYDVVLPYAFLQYADLPQSIRHSQFAICASSPYADSPYAAADFIAYLT